MGPGRCCQTSHCGSSPPLGAVLSHILAPRLIPAFPHSVWGCSCLFFLLSPCRSGCCTQTCERGAAGEGSWFILALVLQDIGLCSIPERFLSSGPGNTQGAHIPTQSRSLPSCKRRLEFRQSRGVRPEFCFSSRMSVPEVCPICRQRHHPHLEATGSLSEMWHPRGQQGPEK